MPSPLHSARRRLQRTAHSARSIARLLGVDGHAVPRTCPLCGTTARFRFFGIPPRPDAWCPTCGSLERHRLLALCDRSSPLFAGRDVLHFAPEEAVRTLIERSARRYVSADLEKGRAETVLDLERIDQPDETWDVVVVSHVLEHVDDRRALREIHRILRPGGTLVAQVPIVDGWTATYENPDATTGRLRELHFGQSDHVRLFGADFTDRLEEAGFGVKTFVAAGEECVRHGLTRGEKVHLARRST